MTSLSLWVIALHLVSVLALSIPILLRRSGASTNRPSFSIVIAAYNELENLKKLIPVLVDQEYPDYEIIVALDRSKDGSKEYLEQMEPKVSYIEIHTTPDGWDHKKFALTQGILKAKGEWIVLTDADCIPYSSRWLESISMEITNRKEILIGVSPYRSKDSLVSSYSQFEGFMTSLLYLGLTLYHKPYMAVGRNMAFKKLLWEEKGGYESIKKVKGGDDDLFIQKNATKLNSSIFAGTKDSLMFTQTKETWSEYWRQKIRHYAVSSSYRKETNFVLSAFHALHLFSIISLIFISQASFFLPIILFYLFIKLVSYRFVASKIGSGFNYILFPFVDIMYAFITPVIGIWSQLIKDVKWKN